MSYPQFRFVDAPSTSATLRLDLNDAGATAGRGVEEDFDLGAPTLEGDPDAVGQTFGFRTLSIPVQITGTKANALAFVSALSREVLRRTNWLRFQLDASSSPVFFKVYRTGYQPLSLQEIYQNRVTGGSAPAGFKDRWRVVVPLVADAFAYGPRETIPQVQIVQSPADLAGPTRYAMRYELPAIKGDAPTPLQVTITPGSAAGLAATGCSWLVGCRSSSDAAADVIQDIGNSDGLSAGTGTGAGVTDSDYFNGSYRVVTISAGQTLAINRLTGNMPNLGLGRYKVMLRYEADGSTTVDRTYLFRMVCAPASTGPTFSQPTASVPVRARAVTAWIRSGWVDLGEMNYPLGVPSNLTGALGPSLMQSLFNLQIATAEGIAGSVRIDALRFIPVDGPTITQSALMKAVFTGFHWPVYQPTPPEVVISGTFDGDSEVYWSTAVPPTSVVGLVPGTPALSGSFPVADPAAAHNVLTVMATDPGDQTVGPGTSTTLINSKDAQLALDVSYHPRYLHIGDGT